MGKRSNFERRKNDDYSTPYEAVLPLLPFLAPGTKFIEPCCGRGDLVHHLEKHGHRCIDSWDLPHDARTVKVHHSGYFFITNPPWTRELLHPIIENLSNQAFTWLLFDADWMHTKQAAPFWDRCLMIVSVGRVKWIPDSPFVGKDNACWYLFDKPLVGEEQEMYGPRWPKFIGRE